MGVTIHFEGSLKDETSYQKLVEVVRAFADQHGWSYEENSNYDAVLERFDQEGADVYEGPAKGIVVMPHEDAEPLRFEFDSDLFVQERIKTQFSNVETHILVVTLLKLVRPLFSHLEVSDEGIGWLVIERIGRTLKWKFVDINTGNELAFPSN